MKISKDKKYKTRNGKEFKLYEIYKYEIHGAYFEDTVWDCQSWSIDGSFVDGQKTCLDLIEISPYADFKIDDKVLVWDEGYSNQKQKGHFAGIDENGNPMTWDYGRTSFTENNKIAWGNCEHD